MNVGDIRRMLLQHPELPNELEVVIDGDGMTFTGEVWPEYVYDSNSNTPGMLVMSGYKIIPKSHLANMVWYQIMANSGPIPSLPEIERPTITEQIEEARDLARTGLMPDVLGYTEYEWAQHKLDMIAAKLTHLLTWMINNYP